jgi:osmotically-inducible protein OsmY
VIPATLPITVDVDNNVVTLRGSVGSATQKAAAAQGVKSVRNQLIISSEERLGRGPHRHEE